jgi:hypothetical protein
MSDSGCNKLEDLPRLSLARGPDVSDQKKSLGLIYSANTKTRNQAIPSTTLEPS